MNISLQGLWTADIGDGGSYPMILPGTLDENKIGHKDVGENPWGEENAIATRFTRYYTYEGETRFTRHIDSEIWNEIKEEISNGKRIFIDAERARVLKLMIDGKEIPDFLEPSLSTNRVFEVTNILKQNSILTLVSDNSYPNMPRDSITRSSAATDETQTNWNGVIGCLRLRTEEPVFVDNIRVYPVGNFLTVKLNLYADRPYSDTVSIQSDALSDNSSMKVNTSEAVSELVFENLPLNKDVRRWDIDEGNLYELSVSISCGEMKRVTFGVRDFGDDGNGRLAINGRTVFLRSEANCAEFPETAYPPMTVAEWRDVLERYRSYGVNCMRFHSHCPPEAAFIAADEMGMLMQPELSLWNFTNAFETEKDCLCYYAELRQILRMYANHPSFVMLTFGNELFANEIGHENMRKLLRLARSIDSTRLYSDSSNCHYGLAGCENESDFYTSNAFRGEHLRGTFGDLEGYLNNKYPSAETNFDNTMEHLRTEYAKPVFSFEVGQFQMLPDFDELGEFHGVTDPVNYKLISARAEAHGFSDVWEKYVEATGELARICYREEIEAAMRTKKMSGISLLGLQDFPGQGTALVGMMNSHLQIKPYEFAKPEHFNCFFRDCQLLVLLSKYTWETNEKFTAEVQCANFGKEDICGEAAFELLEQPMSDKGYSYSDPGTPVFRGTLSKVSCPIGCYTNIGTIEIALDELNINKPTRFNLTACIGRIINFYPIWVYPQVTPICPKDIYETEHLDDKAKSVLEAGGKVYLTPSAEKDTLPSSIKTQFSTDFWSVGTFAKQEGAMGQLIDVNHPIFENFPTEFHTNWQWWAMATQRAAIMPKQYKAIITEIDCYAFLRPMVQLIECCCGKGKLVFSTLGLQNLQRYPEARALLNAIYLYMDSDRFEPENDIDIEEMERLVK